MVLVVKEEEEEGSRCSQCSYRYIWQKQGCFSRCHLHRFLMRHQLVFYQQLTMTLSKYLTHGGISHSIWVFLNCKLFSLKKREWERERAPSPPSHLLFFLPAAKIPVMNTTLFMWFPILLLHCKRLSTVRLIYFSSVGGIGAPTWHSWTSRGWGVGVQRGKPSLGSPSSGDCRWEVNLGNTPETGRHTPINASFAGERGKKKGDRRGSEVCGAARHWKTLHMRWFLESCLYSCTTRQIWIPQKNICTSLTLRSVKRNWHVWCSDSFYHSCAPAKT